MTFDDQTSQPITPTNQNIGLIARQQSGKNFEIRVTSILNSIRRRVELAAEKGLWSIQVNLPKKPWILEKENQRLLQDRLKLEDLCASIEITPTHAVVSVSWYTDNREPSTLLIQDIQELPKIANEVETCQAEVQSLNNTCCGAISLIETEKATTESLNQTETEKKEVKDKVKAPKKEKKVNEEAQKMIEERKKERENKLKEKEELKKLRLQKQASQKLVLEEKKKAQQMKKQDLEQLKEARLLKKAAQEKKKAEAQVNSEKSKKNQKNHKRPSSSSSSVEEKTLDDVSTLSESSN
eukprot:TRINITY_DN3499_c0_g1_i1.p1 TRINITY_DN3499_c0_g1~~TRINITY_DN3499_c0_g1_i1.p1  ORF type:complete len:296 (-),score=82.14 TRINITY_DN3499_c0_g1_i1:45-932(-)